MDKKIRFRRNIYLPWLDAAAALCSETRDHHVIRAELERVVGQQIQSIRARDEAIDMLIGIWLRTGESYPDLHAAALRFFRESEAVPDRLWLHYGLTLLYSDFFRLGVAAIGQISRYADTVTSRIVKTRLAAELGQLGSLDNAADRIMFSLRNWGILAESGQRNVYTPQQHQLVASQPALEEWLLAVALTVHPAQELPFPDLVRLPELFPFRFTVSVDALRSSAWFEVHRQGLGWDMVQRRIECRTAALA
jgi:hypothetical protein